MRCFIDGAHWVIVADDFINLQESPAVFIRVDSRVGKDLSDGGAANLCLDDYKAIKQTFQIGGGGFEAATLDSVNDIHHDRRTKIRLEKEQKELAERVEHPERFCCNGFDERFPIWKCPDCNKLNRFLDTFGEQCQHCGKDHTLDWDKCIVSK